MMYLRFAFCLAFGLAGISILLMTLMDALFVDWDVFADIRKAFHRLFHQEQHRYVHIVKARRKKTSIDMEFLSGGDNAVSALPGEMSLAHRV